jgi:RNA polymerase sigma-70 factor (sigma-E family)
VGRAGSGDLAELYRRYVPDAIRLAYLLTGDRMLAEDLAQDAFARLAGRFEHVRNLESFPAYLRRAVLNLVKNHFRHRSVERRYLKSHGHERPIAAAGPDMGSDAAIRAALLGLPYRQRAAIVLRYFEDLSEQRVAELLGCQPGTVKSLLSRGIASLRELAPVDLGLDVGSADE